MHRIAQEIQLLAGAGYPLVYLLTHEEERALRIVAEGLKPLGRALRVWSLTGGLKGEEGSRDPERLLGALRSAEAGGTALLDFHVCLREPRVVRRLRDLCPILARAGHLVVIVSPVFELPPELEKDLALLELPLPRRSELERLLGMQCAEAGVQVEPEAAHALVRAAAGLTENEARRAFAKVHSSRAGQTLTAGDAGLVIEEKRRALQKSEVLEYYDLEQGLDDVGGLHEVKRWVESRSRAFDEAAQRFGLPPPKGLLLLGVQGCGKSLTAKAVARAYGLPLVRLDLGAVFGAASPESSLRGAFRVIESLAPAVLWVDEIEKGFAGGDGGTPRVFGAFITWLQEKREPVFVVATANEVEHLPPELLRKGRFDETFFVDLPDVHERRAILAIHLKARGRDPAAFDLDGLALKTEHFSGAELEQGVVAGLFRAFERGRDLETADLLHELDEIVPLYATYEEKIKALRDWAKTRARRASVDQSLVDLFGRE